MATPSLTALVVKDANILIDLIEADLLGAWFELGIPTITSDMVVSELRSGKQWIRIEPLIASGVLQVMTIDAEDVKSIIRLKNECNVSVPDGSVLYLAQSKNAKLLTGDRKLRLAAKSNNIDVSGVLWVFDFLVLESIISHDLAATSLRKMLAKGARLPSAEVDKRLDCWEQV